MLYPNHQETVRNLEQLKLEQSQPHQFSDLLPNISRQDTYNKTSREFSHNHPYNDTQAQAQAVAQHYQSDIPSIPVPAQSIPQYTAPAQEPVQEAPYQPPQFLPPDNYPIGNQLLVLVLNIFL